MDFYSFGFDPQLEDGIEAMGYDSATPIQEKAIPVILDGKDLIASAQTGTGKTAAFVLPLINNIISAPQSNKVKALMIVPTRELAVQITQQVDGMAYFTPVGSIAVYGGNDGLAFSREKIAMQNGVEIIVGTPGRLLSHLNMKYIDFSELEYFVLDEADRMLDMGFFDDIMRILNFLPKSRQNLLFSATMPQRIRELARKILNNPVEINIALSKPVEKVEQLAYVVYNRQKIAIITDILKSKKLTSIIVFCSTKINVKELTKTLRKSKFSVDEIHSDLEQKEREAVMVRFKGRSLNILVATDILARGIDVEDIDLVINYDVPNDGESYIHRIGRTARAASNGAAYTFIGETEQEKFLEIENLLGKPVPKAQIEERFGKTPSYNPKSRSKSGNSKKKYFKKSNSSNRREGGYKKSNSRKPNRKN